MMDEPLSNMTLKDFFAALALQGICANARLSGRSYEDMVDRAYKQAELMMERRNEPVKTDRRIPESDDN